VPVAFLKLCHRYFPVILTQFSNDRTGWTVGAGAECALNASQNLGGDRRGG